MLADDLGAAGLAPDLPALSEERIDLLACAREAASALAAAMAPGRRNFRLPPAGDAAHVWADRRAVRQVLGRVLAEAALNTGDGDCISVSLSEATGRVELVVADEGNGLGAAAAEDEPALVPRDSRGIGAPLALARVLMEAHEGRLDVVAAAGAGTKVSLVFPPSRRRSGAPAATCNSRNAAFPS